MTSRFSGVKPFTRKPVFHIDIDRVRILSQTDKKATATADIGAGLDKGFRELALLSFAAAALFYLISLLTFNLEDAGWTHSDGPRITNNAGAVGAWLADFSLSMVGLMAYAFPVLLTILGYSIYRQGHQLIWRNPLTLVFRVAGFVLFIAVGAALADIYWTPSAIRWIHADLALPQSSGGILGEEVAGKLLAAFGSKGTLILLVFSLLAGISLYTGISWLTAVDALGKYTLLVVEGIFSLLSKLSHVEPPAPDAGEPEEETAATPVEPAPPPAKKDKSKPAAARIEPVLASPLPMEDEEEEYRHEEPAKPEKTTEQASSKVEPLNTPAPNPDPTPAQVQDPTPRHAAAPAPVPEAKPQTMAMPQAVKKIKPSELPPIAPGELPTLDLLTQQVAKPKGYTQEALDSMSRLVESILSDFGVEVEVVGVHPGPVITRFEVQPAPGVKASRISGLAKDLARALSVTSVRVVEIIPGKSVIGLEIPNEAREIVLLYEVLASDVYAHADSPLTMVLGKDISGLPVIANLARMPHLLVAGTTGSGKSVAVNVMILSMLYKARPDEVRMIMIDPKMLELSIYEGIPHLLTPVVTDMKEAANALRWSVAEMERRYKLMSMLGVRNLAGYNQKIREAEEAGEPIPDPMWNPNMTLSEEDGPPVLGHLPFIVIVIDELADMMMIVGKKVEELIARLAQKARAAGIHLILATQRPSVDVLTG
jgi:S-DNA-T family DNA segregation ATPase FtsK/SpoIIIE